MTDFKVGQKVWTMAQGWGKVDDIDEETSYPIYVEFDSAGSIRYTKDGREFSESPRTLFFKEIPIPEDALVPPVEEIDLKKGDVVLLKTLTLCIVEENSDSNNIHFKWRSKVARTLDDAFDTVESHKNLIEKVIGNIND